MSSRPPPRAASSSSSSAANVSSSAPRTSTSVFVGSMLFVSNLAVIVLSVLSTLSHAGPLSSHQAYVMSIMASLFSLIVGIIKTHSLPNFGTFKKIWTTVRAGQGGDPAMFAFLTDVRLHYVMYNSLFLTAAPSLMALVPITLLSIFGVCSFLLECMPASPLAPTLRKVTTRWDEIDRINARLEVFNFFFLLFQIFTPSRNLIVTGLYAHAFLRIRYMSNAHAKAAWTLVRQNSDKVFKHPAAPAIVSSMYDKMVNWLYGMGNPVPS